MIDLFIGSGSTQTAEPDVPVPIGAASIPGCAVPSLLPLIKNSSSSFDSSSYDVEKTYLQNLVQRELGGSWGVIIVTDPRVHYLYILFYLLQMPFIAKQLR